MTPPDDDDDDLDGCDGDMAAHADNEQTAALRALFPDGDPATADEWHQLADAGALMYPPKGTRRGA